MDIGNIQCGLKKCSARAQFRKAQLQAKRNAEAAKRKERELLFASVQEGSTSSGPGRRRHQEKLSQDELALNASNEVTAALSRMHQLVQSGLQQSQFATDTLRRTFSSPYEDIYKLINVSLIEQGTAALTSLNESYSTLSSLLTSSRSLVSTLIHSQKSDTWYLETTFYILSATIAWLVFRRLIYGPGWWLLYLPTKLMLRFISSILTVSISVFSAFVSAVGGSGSSAAVSRVGDKISTSLIVKPSATGGIPRFSQVMAAPSIAVGGGGKGGQAPQGNQVPSGDGSVLDQIGKMIDESHEEGETGRGASEQASEADRGTILRARNEDERPNPKKRMFEEPSVERGQGDRVRDEL